ncbi:MAG: hypothetical protein AB9891_18470 [Anaerolineaceae bacterium]
MKIVTNENLIERNKKIGNYLSIGSIVILGVGMYLSFQEDMIQYSYLALIFGFAASQFGISLGNKFGRAPRPFETLNSNLKGLAETFTLYHYYGPTSHLLVGPAGIWVIVPFPQKGTITFENNKWQQKGANWYFKIFAQEGLGKPDKDAKAAVGDVITYLNKNNLSDLVAYVNPVAVFTNDKAIVTAPDAPVPTLHVTKLKDLMRKEAKKNNISSDVLLPLSNLLPKPE